MPRLLVVHHTPSPAPQAMFEAAVSAARTDQIEDVEVVVRPALTAVAVDVLGADGYLLGTPVRISLGTLARQRAVLAAAGRGGLVVFGSCTVSGGQPPRPRGLTERGEGGWYVRDAALSSGRPSGVGLVQPRHAQPRARLPDDHCGPAGQWDARERSELASNNRKNKKDHTIPGLEALRPG